MGRDGKFKVYPRNRKGCHSWSTGRKRWIGGEPRNAEEGGEKVRRKISRDMRKVE